MKLSEFIKEDLKNSIAATGSLPARPSLPALAQHYQVSLTPVRAAVRELVSESYLLKGRNGRLAVNPGHPGNGKEVVEPPPERPRDWEAVLSEEILRLSLEGCDGYLREEATAEKHGIGRTVVRQAFIRLAGSGLVEHVPRCGWRVRTFRFEDMRAFLEVREVLELKALDLARPRLDAQILREMLRGNPASRKKRPPTLDNRLHQYLVDQAQNRFIEGFFSQPIVQYYQALFDHAAPATSVVARMARQHRDILRALIAQDWPAAREALSEHIRSQQKVVRQLMESAGEGR